MLKLVTVVATLAVLLAASAVGAQMQPMTPRAPGQPPGAAQPPGPRSPQHPMMGQGMMGQGMMGQGMMCPMMAGMQEHGMMGTGRPMMGMGGMMNPSDPKAMARMLKLRGDIMNAVGDVMVKHAEALAQEK